MYLPRLLKIIHTLGRYRIDSLLQKEKVPWYIRAAFWFWPWRWFYRTKTDRATRLRMALQDLGTLYIKLGQLLSTRRDLLPDDIADELAKLQDRVPPFPGVEAIAIIESSLQSPIAERFAEFDSEPMASASVAQVHAATLFTGEKVVVKVVRPNIEKVIRKDLSVLYMLARLIHLISEDGRRLRPLEVVQDYQNTILAELDLQREAANCSQLKRNFACSTDLYVPNVYWDFCTKKVLVMERIEGVPIADIQGLKALGVDMKTLAEKGVDIFFTQVFRDRFFHADMHPGNIFVTKNNQGEPCYAAVDFGIIGSLTEEDQSYLARNLLAFFKRDYRQVAKLHIDSGWVSKQTRLNELEDAIRCVCEPIVERPLKDISFGQVLVRLFQIARRFNMEVQPQLILLQKTLINIEGLGRQLYPDLDLWSTGKPYLEKWMKRRANPLRLCENLSYSIPDFIQQIPQLPNLINTEIEQHKLQQQQMQRLLKEQNQSKRQQRLLGCLCLIGVLSIWLTGFDRLLSPELILLAGLGLGLVVK